MNTLATLEQDRARRAIRADYKAGYQEIEGPLQHAVINANVAGNYVLIQGVPGLSIDVYAVFLWTQAVQTLQFFEDTNTLTGPLTDFPATSGFLWPNTGEPTFSLRPGAALRYSMSGAGQVSGWVKFRVG